LAFVALKENRTAKAMWILAPVALLSIIFWAVMNILKMTSGSTAQLKVIFTIMVLGFSMIWLLAERIANRNRFVTFLLAILIYFGFLAVNLLSSGFSKDVIAIASLTAVSIPAIILAFVFAALYSKNSFNVARFIIYIGAALFSVSLIIFASIMSILYTTPINTWIDDLLTVSFFSSLIYYVGLLPFLILLFSNTFWRKRFEAVLRIQTNIPTEPPPPMKTPL
jgi:peptidoglycan/LPS O-acetylase OafA/YrhL